MKPWTYEQMCRLEEIRKDPYKITAKKEKQRKYNKQIGMFENLPVDKSCDFRYLKYMNNLMGKR